MKKWNAFLIKLYNFIISRRWINLSNPFCRKLRSMLFHNICYECRASFGKRNSDRLFYVIRCPQEKMGFFALYNYVVCHVKIALSYHAEPVMDWQYYPNNYVTEDALIGKENAWEYFFEQPANVSLGEVYQSRNVIMSHGNWEASLAEVYHPDELQKSHELIQKYMKLNEKTKQYIEKEYSALDMSGKRIMGVKCRGTDFTATKPKGHSICPNAEETYKKIEELEEIWGKYDKIFLATEDQRILSEMKKHFGDRLIYTQEDRFTDTGKKWLGQLYDSKQYQGKKYKDMLAYLCSIYLLTSCDALVAPVVGATLGAMRIKGVYENYYFFDLGSYN